MLSSSYGLHDRLERLPNIIGTTIMVEVVKHYSTTFSAQHLVISSTSVDKRRCVKLLSEEQCVRSVFGAAGLVATVAVFPPPTLPPIAGNGASFIFFTDSLAAFRAWAVFSINWLERTGGGGAGGGGGGGGFARRGGGGLDAAVPRTPACAWVALLPANTYIITSGIRQAAKNVPL